MAVPPPRKFRPAALLVHTFRLGLLGCILWLIFRQQAQLAAELRASGLNDLPIAEVQSLFPSATSLGEAEGHGGRRVLSEEGRIGSVVQTFPEGEAFLGFSGPTNLLIGFSPEGTIVGLSILSSRDTRDHVNLIRNDSRFMTALNGKEAREAANLRVDAVTGATLTSLAILQGIQARLGRQPGSLKFPDAYTLEDARRFFPEAASLKRDELAPELWLVESSKPEPLGWLLSNSPGADELIGYQGPTRAFLGLRLDGKILGLVVGESFDNDPYVGSVRDDKWFSKLFTKKPLKEWAKLSWDEAGIEGVSGATMTSQAVAEGLLAAARKIERLRTQAVEEQQQIKTSRLKAALTIACLLAGLLVGMTRLRQVRWLRRTYQIVLIAVMGLLNGDLLSMAMFVGWAQNGIPWRNALGLVCLSGAALSVPILFQQNIYCDHLCPHGAVQQLLPRRWKLKQRPRFLIRMLGLIRPVLLGIVVLVPMLSWKLSLVDLEPFDAYAWRAAGWATIAIALGGLLFSLFIPMGYCHYGCPTGAVLGYLRRHSRSDRLTRSDALAICLLCIALVCTSRWGPLCGLLSD